MSDNPRFTVLRHTKDELLEKLRDWTPDMALTDAEWELLLREIGFFIWCDVDTLKVMKMRLYPPYENLINAR